MQYEGEGTCRSGLGQQSGCDIQGPHRAGCCGAEQDWAGWQLRGGLQADTAFQVLDVRGTGQVFGTGWSVPCQTIQQWKFADRGDVLSQLAIGDHVVCWCGSRDDCYGALMPRRFPAFQQLHGTVQQFLRNAAILAAFEPCQFFGPAGIVGEGDRADRKICLNFASATAAFGPLEAGFYRHIHAS